MWVDFKIPYEQKIMSPAAEFMIFCAAIVVVALGWYL